MKSCWGASEAPNWTGFEHPQQRWCSKYSPEAAGTRVVELVQQSRSTCVRRNWIQSKGGTGGTSEASRTRCRTSCVPWNGRPSGPRWCGPLTWHEAVRGGHGADTRWHGGAVRGLPIHFHSSLLPLTFPSTPEPFRSFGVLSRVSGIPRDCPEFPESSETVWSSWTPPYPLRTSLTSLWGTPLYSPFSRWFCVRVFLHS
jgi:hypothetical protein